MRDRWFKSTPRNQFRELVSVYAMASPEHQVYLIENPDGRLYIGLSEDVDRRLGQHNAGESRWTRNRGPWSLRWTSSALSLTEARRLENKLKKQKGGDGLYRILGITRTSS